MAEVVQPTPYVRPAGYAERYRDRRFRTGTGRGTDRRERRAIRALLARGRAPEGPWLDAPCGAGRLSELLPGPVVQLDVDTAMLRACGTTGQPTLGRVRASAHELPFADDSFAGALCMRLLQHLPTSAERIAVLRELRRVTRGPVLLSFFHSGSLPSLRRELRARFGRRRSGRRAISLRTMLGDLEAADLAVTAVQPLLLVWSEQWLLRCGRRDADPTI